MNQNNDYHNFLRNNYNRPAAPAANAPQPAAAAAPQRNRAPNGRFAPAQRK